MSLTSLTADQGLIGGVFAKYGVKIAYTRIGITVALIFVGIPFVVRSVQPVFRKIWITPMRRLPVYLVQADLRYSEKLFFQK